MDDFLEKLVERASERMDANQELFDGYFPAFIYGAGAFGRDVHRALVDAGLPVAGFIDHMERDARRLISEHTPGIAVSLYHRPEHLWQLPMLVENIAPGKYNFHMRSHAMNDFELVLYALPKEWK